MHTLPVRCSLFHRLFWALCKCIIFVQVLQLSVPAPLIADIPVRWETLYHVTGSGDVQEKHGSGIDFRNCAAYEMQICDRIYLKEGWSRGEDLREPKEPLRVGAMEEARGLG